MFLLPIKLDRVSFETKGRQNLQKTADFLIESIVFCPLVPPSWISLVDPTSAMYASAIYVSYIYEWNDRYRRHRSPTRPNQRSKLKNPRWRLKRAKSSSDLCWCRNIWNAGVERKVDGLDSCRTCCLTSCTDLAFIKCHWSLV